LNPYQRPGDALELAAKRSRVRCAEGEEAW